jgi:hypothetical protein
VVLVLVLVLVLEQAEARVETENSPLSFMIFEAKLFARPIKFTIRVRQFDHVCD